MEIIRSYSEMCVGDHVLVQGDADQWWDAWVYKLPPPGTPPALQTADCHWTTIEGDLHRRLDSLVVLLDESDGCLVNVDFLDGGGVKRG